MLCDNGVCVNALGGRREEGEGRGGEERRCFVIKPQGVQAIRG